MWYEPTDIQKATKIFETGSRWRDVLHFVSPNRNELGAIGEFFDVTTTRGTDLTSTDLVTSIAERLIEHIPVIVTTLGSQGVLVGVAN